MEDNYICTLSAACLKQAKEELNEDPHDRLSAVQALREWILAQPHIKYRTDTVHLIKFLRASKFSQLRARERLEGYLSLKTELPHLYREWSPTDPFVAPYIKEGVVVLLPGYYKNGSKVVIIRSDVHERVVHADRKESRDGFRRVLLLLLHHCLRDENVQVSGFLLITDFTNYSMKAARTYSIAERKELMRFQGKMPENERFLVLQCRDYCRHSYKHLQIVHEKEAC